MRARRSGLLARLTSHAAAHHALVNGHHLTFAASAETLTLILTAVDAERRCCEFLRFQITIEPAAGPVMLDVTGPEGTREFLSTLLE